MDGSTWTVAPQEVRDSLAAWAARYGLQRVDRVLPAASERLHQATELLGPENSFVEGWGDHPVQRPGRFSEGTYMGTLPGDVGGLVGHHSYLKGQLYTAGQGSHNVWYVEPLTAVVLWLPDAARAAREVIWTEEDGWSVEPDGAVVTLPALSGLDGGAETPTEERLVVLGSEGLEVITLAGSVVTARDGWVVAEAPAYLLDAEALCRAATETAVALRRAAAGIPPLAPGDSLADEPPLPDLPPVEWPRPPADTREAVAGYMDAGRDAVRVEGRFGRLMKRVGVNVMHGVHAHTAKARAWGVEGFAREYARARGLRVTDREEFRRRMTMPVPGHARRSLQGALPGGLDGHLVLWEDPTVPNGRRLLDLAIVPAAGEGAPQPGPGFEAWRSGPWLIVGREPGDEGNSVAGLEAAALEATRLAGQPSASTFSNQ
jgi:hypothetical protein